MENRKPETENLLALNGAVRRSATYIGTEFPEYKGHTFLIDDDLNDEGCCIMKVGLDWINSIPQEDLHFA